MINLKDISKSFRRGSPDEIKLFENLNLEIKKNEFVVVIGSNGSGKSTLLNLIAGTVKPDSGSIYFDKKNITNKKDFERSEWIVRIFQNPLSGTASELSILENFRLASLRRSSKGFTIGTNKKFRSIVQEKISILNLGLENKIDQAMGSLSGGQRQALALLMAIMDETSLLLLDEPAAALDPRTSDLIMRLTKRVIREYNLTALLVTHNIKDVLDYGSRIIQMKEGSIVRDILKENSDELTMNVVFEWFNS
jgi:putative ABC transport system ATP-binding protein